MKDTASRQNQPEEPIWNECDAHTHAHVNNPQGRLILVLEHELSDSSRISLHKILKNIMPYDDITMISGLSRASMLQAEKMGNGLFYNRKEYLSPEKAFRMLPWREVWVIAGGHVWALQPVAG